MDYIKPVVNYRFELFEGPLTKGQFSQLTIGIDTSSFQFWKLHTPLINFNRLDNVVPPVEVSFFWARSAALICVVLNVFIKVYLPQKLAICVMSTTKKHTNNWG